LKQPTSNNGSILYTALITVLVLFVLLPAGFLFYVYHSVTLEAAERIERGVIDDILASESPVYYDDGKTPIGVFFEKTHRKYIRYEKIPKVFIKAIVAAEDRSFFEHHGVDLKAVVRAMIANIKAGKVVQGGSTITQQTAKNIFKREKRSYRAKMKELCQAFLLERNYSKEEILEMYVNQFFVTGYGKGLRIASQYFFDKEVEDLDLVEAAFIAGSLKAPSRYNPFTKTTPQSRARARRLAKERTNYVLSSMHGLNFISTASYREALERDVPFREGKISYRLNVVMDYIRSQLESAPFRRILEEQGVDNIATSGISISTSMNKDLQNHTVESLRKHLPRLDIQLRSYRPDEDPELSGSDDAAARSRPESTLPFPVEVTGLDPADPDALMTVRWENGSGVINFEGVQSVGEAWVRSQKGRWTEFSKNHLHEFLSLFHRGMKVWACRLEGENLILAHKPKLEGAVVVLKEGMVKAMAGGFYNRFFNRAVDAKRQLGSIFKPLAYSAALQLKWNSLDPLGNQPDLYCFQTTRYVPEPDHSPEAETVSLAWAGVQSENLASVRLMSELTDHLTLHEFEIVARSVGLAPHEKESYNDYARRIRDRHGVIVNDEAMMEAAFMEAKASVRSEIIFADYPDTNGLLETVDKLHFRIDDASLEKDERKALEKILPLDYSRMVACNLRMKRLKAVESPAPQVFYRMEGIRGQGRTAYLEDMSLAPDGSLTPLDSANGVHPSDIWINGRLPSRVLDALRQTTAEHFQKLKNKPRYSMEILRNIRDFKILINLNYVLKLAEHMGIYTEMEPAFSFPLGAHSVSIMEAAVAYQTIMTGVRPVLFPDNPDIVPVITKINGRDKETIWEYKPSPQRVLSREVSSQMMEILRLVVARGTGKRAERAVRFQIAGKPDSDVIMPVYGKTGTANNFMNSSFAGCIPGPNAKTGVLTPGEGYTIAAYVGYDDNRPMESSNFSVYGATGALPVWIDVANAVVSGLEWKKRFRPADLIFSTSDPHLDSTMLKRVTVSPVSGLPAEAGVPFHALLKRGRGRHEPLRLFEPIEETP
jgi:penicillin-binding protein 1A